MARSTATIAARIRANLDPAFHGWGAHLDGLAAAMNNAESLTDGQIPLSSIRGFAGETEFESAFLDMIGRSDGVDRLPDESNASYRARIRAGAMSSDVVSLDAALDALVATLTAGLTYQIVEHWDARPYCDDDATEYVTDLFCDGQNLLGTTRGLTVVLDAAATEADEDAVLALLASWRAAGVRCWVVTEDDLTPAVGWPWTEA